VEFRYEKGIFITAEINGWILALRIDITDLESDDSQDFLKKASLDIPRMSNIPNP